jgi:hypothetical protein
MNTKTASGAAMVDLEKKCLTRFPRDSVTVIG